MEALRGLRPSLHGALSSAASWFRGCTIQETHRLHYAFHPAAAGEGRWEDRSCPIRDVGTAADLAVLQRRLAQRRQFDEVIASTLRHYTGLLVQHEDDGGEPWCHLAAGRRGLGEPSSVAHSSMLLLALAAWEGHPDEAERRRHMAQLAAGIMHQQRKDGSFRVYFEPAGLPDSGWQLYGGEAAYALATACDRLGERRLLEAASCALWAYRDMYRRGGVSGDELVFFANWQLQAAAAVHRHAAGDPELRRGLASYLHELQDDVVESGFFADVAADPHRQATVEVACALEGLAHCLAASLEQAAAERAARGAAAAGEAERHELYAECALMATRFLLEAQVQAGPGVPAASVGGFGHTQRAGSGQRVDVTGHVCCAFSRLLEILDQQHEE